MNYYLMRKNNKLGVISMNESGQVIHFKADMNNLELPLAYKNRPDYLMKWWDNRCVPLSRNKVDQMLAEKGIISNNKSLLNNLGLSLTDYYWIKPFDSKYTWEDVNLFENDFKDDFHIFKMNENGSKTFSPNSSLQGDLEKTWLIMNKERVLVKGNESDSSKESINEVVATAFHKKQGFKNYTEYKLINIKNKQYKYGCYCKSFTNLNVEFISAYDLLVSEEKPNNMSDYEYLISLAKKYGANENEIRRDLEYQILSDYILSNIDRHMNNIGFLRDANTLKIISMAPIFDTGNSMFNEYIPRDLTKLKVNSFSKNEKKLLDYVTDTNLIDFNKLLTKDEIRKLYLKDETISKEYIGEILDAYEKKIMLLKNHLHI